MLKLLNIANQPHSITKFHLITTICPFAASSTSPTILCPIRPFSRQYWQMERPPPAKYQMRMPPGERGHFHYEHYWSNDPRYRPQLSEDTWRSYFWGVYDQPQFWAPYLVMIFCVITGIIWLIYTDFKIEIWMDRSCKTPPWDWSRVRGEYWKLPTIMYDPTGATHQRLEIMERLEEEMMEAAIRRGTRDEATGEWLEK